MNNDIAENIIAKMKSNKNGLTSLMQIKMVVADPNLRTSIIESLITDFELIDKIGNDFRLTKKGSDFTSFADLEQDEINAKEREHIEFEKSKIDLELAKKMLREYPKTKWFARIGFFIGIVLAIVQLIQWIIKLSSI